MADRLVPIDTAKPVGGQFPGLVSAEIQALIAAAPAADTLTVIVDVFPALADGATPANWTKRPGTLFVIPHLYGGGGGGGAGAKGPTGSALVGGGGGGSGAYITTAILADDLPATVPVTVGKGGAGAPGQATNSTAGATGTAGTQTSFGTLLAAGRGSGGVGGGTATGGTGGFGGGTGAVGATASATGAVAAQPSHPIWGPGSGGAGGGITTAGAASAGGPSGTSGQTGRSTQGGTNAVGGAGIASAIKGSGSGGGGGGASITGNGFAGGAGGIYGGGGGGGGAALNDKGTSGGGGAGADGIAVVITFIGPATSAAVTLEESAEVAAYTLQASDKEKRFAEPTRVTVPSDLAVRKGKRFVLAGEYVEVVPDGDDGGAFPAAVVHGEAVLVRVSSTEWGLTGDVEPLADDAGLVEPSGEPDVDAGLVEPSGEPDADGLYPTSADEPVAVEVVDPEASPEQG